MSRIASRFSDALPLEDATNKAITKVARGFGLAFGIGTQLFFFYTVVYLFLFLRFGAEGHSSHWWWIDPMLAFGFAVPHSILLAPPMQKWMKQFIPNGMLGCIHCSVTCASLLIMFHFWGRSDVTIWNAGGWIEFAILVCFYGSWAALLYSLWLTGMGYQTGLTQWWYWATKQKPPVRPFVTNSLYRWMRHPIYMSFLGLIWFTPQMTLDHAILTAVWTGYIYAGSYFKDQRLLRYVGEPYREYGSRVVGLPIIGFGSLRRFTQTQEG